MSADQMIDQRYPIGKFVYEKNVDNSRREIFISDIEFTPIKLKEAIDGLSEKQLDTQYREGGWTVRQVVHHLPDSHINAFVRFKLALTEDNPTVKTYNEKKWAELKDYSQTPIDVSLNLLNAIHKRWIILIKSMEQEDFKRTYYHPDSGKVELDWVLAQYAWHGKHHVAHITSLRKRNGW